ncbi:sensor histidine kinase [Inconstantimicrobium porci]|uniref:sensor histidine kinase n=1 Tax=Inconstantimicrobium porci TaxID=2652291 RepID=UPI002409D694|nr:ATP-binding protein [Inconstantimicrobium porci]MDD6770192.1 ATP-binding protein [Inconstantimicrobium porci]
MEFDLNIENSVIKGMNKKLQQLFINVLDNAVKYSVPNSKVNISIINKEKDVDIIIENVNETECIENTEELFKPFIKINSEERGSRGLGLNICRKIVAMHNGTIKILWSNYKVKTIITLPYK